METPVLICQFSLTGKTLVAQTMVEFEGRIL